MFTAAYCRPGLGYAGYLAGNVPLCAKRFAAAVMRPPVPRAVPFRLLYAVAELMELIKHLKWVVIKSLSKLMNGILNLVKDITKKFTFLGMDLMIIGIILMREYMLLQYLLTTRKLE